MSDFFEKNKKVLENYLRISTKPGSRSDYVQGGGGNTSCKFDDRMMAIKASGYRLNQIAFDDGYTVLDYAAIAAFYAANDPKNLTDVEKAGSEAVKAAVCELEGIPVLRPSVEAGFHSLLGKYVLHTHPVYANLAACCTEGREVVRKALSQADYAYGFVPYINPGAQLTFEIDKELKRVKATDGRFPSVIIMQNHGLIVTHEDPDECLRIHEDANQRIAAQMGVTMDFPAVAVRSAGVDRCNDSTGPYFSDTSWLTDRIANSKYDMKFFCQDALYPDQLVFLEGNMTILNEKLPESPEEWNKGKCVIYRGSGHILYNCTSGEAKTIEEMLCAVIYIVSTIEAHGCIVSTMSDSGKDFIANWESEKYRKSIKHKG